MVAPGTRGTCPVALSLQGPSPSWKTLGVPASGLPTTVQEQGLASGPVLQKNNSERWPECLGASATKVGHHREKSG